MTIENCESNSGKLILFSGNDEIYIENSKFKDNYVLEFNNGFWIMESTIFIINSTFISTKIQK